MYCTPWRLSGTIQKWIWYRLLVRQQMLMKMDMCVTQVFMMIKNFITVCWISMPLFLWIIMLLWSSSVIPRRRKSIEKQARDEEWFSQFGWSFIVRFRYIQSCRTSVHRRSILLQILMWINCFHLCLERIHLKMSCFDYRFLFIYSLLFVLTECRIHSFFQKTPGRIYGLNQRAMIWLLGNPLHLPICFIIQLPVMHTDNCDI